MAPQRPRFSHGAGGRLVATHLEPGCLKVAGFFHIFHPRMNSAVSLGRKSDTGSERGRIAVITRTIVEPEPPVNITDLLLFN